MEAVQQIARDFIVTRYKLHVIYDAKCGRTVSSIGAHAVLVAT